MSPPLLLYVGDGPTSLALLDFDNDGDNDIAVIATSLNTNERAVLMYRNDTSLNGGILMFAYDESFDQGLNPVLVAKGDIDGDNHDDLVTIAESLAFRGAAKKSTKFRNTSLLFC
ncbi:MAG TPA: VCBS repeat-containing protein [Phycisphaerales bacterium]|nr:VCBS repeat-containing protein [Phycisphaerales bacterium]